MAAECCYWKDCGNTAPRSWPPALLSLPFLPRDAEEEVPSLVVSSQKAKGESRDKESKGEHKEGKQSKKQVCGAGGG